MRMRGVVLAGGQSRRFGRNKALVRMEGMPLVARAVALVEACGLTPLVLAGLTQDYSFLQCRVERDWIPDQGPLGGLLTAACLSHQDPFLVLGCDMPGVDEACIRLLLGRHTGDNWATVFQEPGGKFLPFPGVYEPEIADRALGGILRGERSLKDFLLGLPRIQAIHLGEVEHPAEVMANLNTTRELQRWKERRMRCPRR